MSRKLLLLVGSWTFVVLQTLVIIIYISWQSYATQPFDAYPFILLNLAISIQTAIIAPIILMESHKDKETIEAIKKRLDKIL
jgi:uncharacterized membrane protein